MFKCRKCKKIYKRENAFIRHEGICKQKQTKTRPSLDQMWNIILKQQKQLAQQKKEIDKLKRTVNKDVKTINIKDLLNEKVKRNINFSLWVSRYTSITYKHMRYIMKNTFSDAVPILLDYIKEMDIESIPIYCFNHEKTIYIYENEWIKATSEHMKLLLDEIKLQLLRHNIEYEKTLDEKTLYSKKHLEKNEKLYIVQPKKKVNIQNKLKSELLNLLKIDINDLNKYKFAI